MEGKISKYDGTFWVRQIVRQNEGGIRKLTAELSKIANSFYGKVWKDKSPFKIMKTSLQNTAALMLQAGAEVQETRKSDIVSDTM